MKIKLKNDYKKTIKPHSTVTDLGFPTPTPFLSFNLILNNYSFCRFHDSTSTFSIYISVQQQSLEVNWFFKLRSHFVFRNIFSYSIVSSNMQKLQPNFKPYYKILSANYIYYS